MVTQKHRATLKDVATRVGVSINAASIVLNNTRSTGEVGHDTRRRILEAAKELGYRPNPTAQSLVRQRSNNIGLFFDGEIDTGEPFTAALIAGAERGCRERHQSLVLITKNPAETDEEVCSKLLNSMVDGIAITGWTGESIQRMLIDAGIPLVQYPYFNPNIPSVVVDEASGAHQAMSCLVAAGHQRVYYRTLSSVENIRCQRNAEAASDFGIQFKILQVADKEGNLSDEEKALLTLPREDRPTAVICWNDAFAYKILNYCTRNGIRVPEDLAIIGCDGARTFPDPIQRLTSVHIPWFDVARTVVSLLVDIRDGKSVQLETELPVTLRLGGTV